MVVNTTLGDTQIKRIQCFFVKKIFPTVPDSQHVGMKYELPICKNNLF